MDNNNDLDTFKKQTEDMLFDFMKMLKPLEEFAEALRGAVEPAQTIFTKTSEALNQRMPLSYLNNITAKEIDIFKSALDAFTTLKEDKEYLDGDKIALSPTVYYNVGKLMVLESLTSSDYLKEYCIALRRAFVELNN